VLYALRGLPKAILFTDNESSDIPRVIDGFIIEKVLSV
jgi:hypothetical protein